MNAMGGGPAGGAGPHPGNFLPSPVPHGMMGTAALPPNGGAGPASLMMGQPPPPSGVGVGGGPMMMMDDPLSFADFMSSHTVTKGFVDVQWSASHGDDTTQHHQSCMAVDGHYWLSLLLKEMNLIDPLWCLHATVPKEVLLLAEEFVQCLRRYRVEPIFVFNGVRATGDCGGAGEMTTPEQDIAQSDVWDELETGVLPGVAESENAFPLLPPSLEMIRAVQLHLLKVCHATSITAPFLHWCQMAVLHAEGEVQHLFASPDMLLVPYPPMRLITHIHFHTEKVEMIDRAYVCKQLFPTIHPHVADGLLMDLGLLKLKCYHILPVQAGTFLATHDLVQKLSALASSTEGKYEKLVLDFIDAEGAQQDMNSGSGMVREGLNRLKHTRAKDFVRFNTVMVRRPFQNGNHRNSTGGHSPLPLDFFCRAIANCLDSISGGLRPGLPRPLNELTGVFGNAVPQGLLFLHFTGLLSPDVTTVTTQAYFSDSDPLVDTKEYRAALQTLVAFRSQSYYQVIQTIPCPMYQQHVSTFSWVQHSRRNQRVDYPQRGRISLWDWDLTQLFQTPQLADMAEAAAEAEAETEWSEGEDEDEEDGSGKEPSAAATEEKQKITTADTAKSNQRLVLDVTILRALETDSAYCTRGPRDWRNELQEAELRKQPLYVGKYQTYFAILLRTFDFLGYFTHDKVEMEEDPSDWHPLPDVQSGGDPPSRRGSTPLSGLFSVSGSPVSQGVDGVPERDPQTNSAQQQLSPPALPVYSLKDLLTISLQHSPSDIHDPLILLTEMIRIGTIHGEVFHYRMDVMPTDMMSKQDSYDSDPSMPRYSSLLDDSEERSQSRHHLGDPADGGLWEAFRKEQPAVLLLSRIACLLSVPYTYRYGENEPTSTMERAAVIRHGPYAQLGTKPVRYRQMDWAPVYSRHLCAFAVIARSVSRGLREMVENIASALYLNRASSCSLEEFASLFPVLPFTHPRNFVGGLLLHYVLVFPDDYQANCTTPQSRLALLSERFSFVPDVSVQLKRVMEFTFSSLFLLKAFTSNGEQLVDADSGNVGSLSLIDRCVELLTSKWELHFGGCQGEIPSDPFMKAWE